MNTALVKVIPFLDRPFKDFTAISRWLIGQLPVDLAPDGRGLRRALTNAEMTDTKHVLAECIIIVQQANEQRKFTVDGQRVWTATEKENDLLLFEQKEKGNDL